MVRAVHRSTTYSSLKNEAYVSSALRALFADDWKVLLDGSFEAAAGALATPAHEYISAAFADHHESGISAKLSAVYLCSL
jgi:hypothetical protein